MRESLKRKRWQIVVLTVGLLVVQAPLATAANNVKIRDVYGPDADLVEFSKKTWRLSICTPDESQFERAVIQSPTGGDWWDLTGVRKALVTRSEDCYNGDHLIQFSYTETSIGDYDYRLKLWNKYRFWKKTYSYFTVEIVKSSPQRRPSSSPQRSIQNYNACLQAHDWNRFYCAQYDPNSLWR